MSGATKRCVLIAAGGTGGHVFPALAVAAELTRRGVHVAWLGSAGGMERALVQRAGIAFHPIDVGALRGKGLGRLPGALLRTVRAVWAARGVLARTRPDVVLGMGGYVSGPAGVAAWLKRCPLVVHEQNAIAGLTNRILRHLARRVLEAFPGSFPSSPKVAHTGNPVRSEIAELPPPAMASATHDHGADDGVRVFVLGGSQGALVLNQCVPGALASVSARHALDVCHQCGANHVQATRDAYRAAGLSVEPLPFIEDMAARYGWADLVICRAGAMTVAELAAAGVASVLVPFPFAVDDHQTANARFLSDAGAAVLVPQADLDRCLSRVLEELLGERDRLLDMARRARALAMPDAGRQVADHCLEVARA